MKSGPESEVCCLKLHKNTRLILNGITSDILYVQLKNGLKNIEKCKFGSQLLKNWDPNIFNFSIEKK